MVYEQYILTDIHNHNSYVDMELDSYEKFLMNLINYQSQLTDTNNINQKANLRTRKEQESNTFF